MLAWQFDLKKQSRYRIAIQIWMYGSKIKTEIEWKTWNLKTNKQKFVNVIFWDCTLFWYSTLGLQFSNFGITYQLTLIISNYMSNLLKMFYLLYYWVDGHISQNALSVFNFWIATRLILPPVIPTEIPNQLPVRCG